MPYQAVVRVQAAVAAGLGDVGRVAQHAPVPGLVHPAGGAPRVAAVMAICKTGGKHRWLAGLLLLYSCPGTTNSRTPTPLKQTPPETKVGAVKRNTLTPTERGWPTSFGEAPTW